MSWTDQGVDRYFIREVVGGTDRYLGTVVGATSVVLADVADGYVVRVRVDGQVRDARCTAE